MSQTTQFLTGNRRDDSIKSSWADFRTLFDADNVLQHRVASTQASERDKLASKLQQVQTQRCGLELDFTGLGKDALAPNASKRRLGMQWILDIGNLLLGQYNDISLRVILPAATNMQLPLIRGSLYFSLVQRNGHSEIVCRDQSEDIVVWRNLGNFDRPSPHSTDIPRDLPVAMALKRNYDSWRPGNHDQDVLLEEAVGEKLQERTYLFSNTHATTELGYFRRYQSAAAFPWLHDVVPNPRDRVARRIRRTYMDFVGDTLVEVLDNISRHAFDIQSSEFQAKWLGNNSISEDRSCMLVGLTEGGTGSYNRLYFTVFDNGLGIPRTMRWKHKALHKVGAGRIIECILNARLKGRDIDGHVGGGLWYLGGLAGCAGGTVIVTSEDNHTGDTGHCPTAVRVTVTVPPFLSEESPRFEIEQLDLPLRGTVIQLQAQVPQFGDFDQVEIEKFKEYCYKDREKW